MNHTHTCPTCGVQETCDWGYDDEECGMWYVREIECASCEHSRMMWAITHKEA